MSDWRPIETAPKDGTRIIIFGSVTDMEPEPRMGWWGDYDAAGELGEPLWVDDDGSEIEGATHWMPLPSPPEVQP